MADFPPNLDDGELWLPSNIIRDVGGDSRHSHHQHSLPSFPVDELSAKPPPSFGPAYIDDLACQLAAIGRFIPARFTVGSGRECGGTGMFLPRTTIERKSYFPRYSDKSRVRFRKPLSCVWMSRAKSGKGFPETPLRGTKRALKLSLEFCCCIYIGSSFYFNVRMCYAEKQALGEVNQELLDTQVNPAVWEISGHIVLKRKKDYEEASEDYAWRLLAEVSLSEERFQEVKAYIFEVAGLVESEEDNINEEASYEPSAPVIAAKPRFPDGCMVLQ